jgi:hypothetical protein
MRVKEYSNGAVRAASPSNHLYTDGLIRHPGKKGYRIVICAPSPWLPRGAPTPPRHSCNNGSTTGAGMISAVAARKLMGSVLPIPGTA